MMKSAAAVVLTLVSVATPVQAQATAPAVTVSPNLRLIPGDHNEPWIAISQRNPDVMIAVSQQGAMSADAPRFKVSTVISRDGGRTWTPVNLPEPAETPFDPMVAAGPDGELYVMHGVIGGAFLSMLGVDSGEESTIRFWSSTDDGWTWSRPTDFTASVPPDHMRMVIDMTSGPQRGRIYVAWNDVSDQFVRDQYEVFLQYSDDRGRSFTDPILVATGTDGKLVATEPVVLSDGTLLVTWYQYWNPLAREENERMPFYVRRSADGGRTFEPVEKIFEFGPHIARHRVPEYPRAFSLPIVTADTSSRSRYRDNVYISFDDAREGESNIWFVRSTDRGRTWSAPRKINDNADRGPLGLPDHRIIPVVATAPNGDVGLLWYDRRDDPTRRCWHMYFALSRDGGRTFSANQRITTQPSCPPPGTPPTALVHNLSPRRRDPNTPPDSMLDRMNLLQRLGTWTTQVNNQVRDEANANLTDGRLTLSFGGARNISPGHYTGLAADRNGNFHGLWLDRRSGSQELYTARITPGAPQRVTGGAATDVTKLVEVVAAVPTYDAPTGTIKVAVQLRNVSDQAIAGPVTLRIVDVSQAGGQRTSVFADSAAGGAATREFSFAGKLGNADVLQPGDLSEPVEITVQVKPETGYDTALDFRVTGVTRAR
jgi:hypothetical protein